MICAIAEGLAVNTVFKELMGVGHPVIERVDWSAAVRPGDEVRLRMEILESRVSPSSTAAWVRWRWGVSTQVGTQVLDLIAATLVECSDEAVGDVKTSPGDSVDEGPKESMPGASSVVRSTEYDFLDPKNWIAPAALAAILGLSRQTIYNRIYAGRDLPPHYKQGQSIRFFRPEVEVWMAKVHRVPVADQL